MKKIEYLNELLTDIIFDNSDLYEAHETTDDECPEEKLKIQWGGYVDEHSRKLTVTDSKGKGHFFKVKLIITKSRKS